MDAAGDSKCAGAVFKVYEVNEKGEKTELPDYTVSAAKNEAKEIYALSLIHIYVYNNRYKETFKVEDFFGNYAADICLLYTSRCV